MFEKNEKTWIYSVKSGKLFIEDNAASVLVHILIIILNF